MAVKRAESMAELVVLDGGMAGRNNGRAESTMPDGGIPRGQGLNSFRFLP